jgi:hypothetical protein
VRSRHKERCFWQEDQTNLMALLLAIQPARNDKDYVRNTAHHREIRGVPGWGKKRIAV